MKIITANDLVPCQKGRTLALPITGNLQDLTEDPKLARDILRKIDSVFGFNKRVATLSGFGRKETDAYVYVQVWAEEEVIRTFAFHNLGYAGIVHIDLIKPEGGQRVYEGDLLGDLVADLEDLFHTDNYFLRNRIFYVRDGNIQLDLPLDHWGPSMSRLPVFGYYVGGNFPPE